MNRMFKWFTNLFVNEQEATKQPLQEEIIPDHMEGISEPVLSFVEAFRKNPKRFKCGYTRMYVFDMQNDIIFELKRKHSNSNHFGHCVFYTLCINNQPTEDFSDKEISFVIKQIQDYYEDRRTRLNAIKKLRADRMRLTRDKLMRIYCNEEQS